MLRIRVLGELELEGDGVALQAPAGRPARALLAWLVLHPGVQARSTIAGSLWPNVLEESARRSLRNALSVMRGALGSAGEVAIIARRETVGFAGEPDIWIDVRAFNDLFTRGRYHEALELCRGDLLVGLDDDWVLTARDEHRERRGEALGRLAAAAAAAGDLDAAVSHARRRAALDPLGELAHQDLMSRLASSGDRAGALVVYETLAERLRRELGVPPSPQTRLLASQLRDRTSPWAGAAPPISAQPEFRVPTRLELARRRGPLLGRDAEVDQLCAQWDLAISSAERRLVLVSGEPGIGKTRLAAELAERVQTTGGAVLYGRAEQDALTPYQPFIEAMREPLQQIERPLAAYTGRLARFLGAADVGDVEEQSGVAGSETSGARLRMFEAIAELLTAVAGDRPLLLVLDDLHWADASTMRLFAHLAARATGPPSLVLCTYRETDVAEGHPLLETIGDIQRDLHLDRLALAGLDEAAVARLVERSLGHSSPARVVQALRAQSAGNPFFVEELLRGLDEDELQALPDGSRRVPVGAVQAVARRVNRLGTAAGALLTAGALTGPEFELQVAAEVVGLPPDAALDVLDAAVRARIVNEVAESPGRYAFVHALSRDAMTGALSAARRARLHGVIAQALATRAAGDPDRYLAALAHHALEAAPVGDPEGAAAIAERAAARASAVYAYEDAAALLRRALKVLEQVGCPPARRAELMCKLGDALDRSGARRDARDAFTRASELARLLADAPLLARAALGLGGIGVTIFEPDPALVDQLQEALEALGDGDDALRARLLARIATELAYESDGTRREAASRGAVECARQLGDQAVLAAALGARHVALWGPDHIGARLQCATEMVAAAQQAGADELELEARNWRALDLLELGHGQELRAEIDALALLATRARLPTYSWQVPTWRATLALMEGRIEEGMQLALTVRELGHRAGDANAEMCFIHHRFTRLMMDDRHAEALGEFYVREADYAAQKLESPAGPAYRATFAWLLAAAGREDEARTHLDFIAADQFSVVPRDVNWMAATSAAADACLLLGDAVRARLVLQLIEPFADRIAVSARGSAVRGSMSRFLGQLAAMLGEYDAADAYFTRARERDERLGAPVWLAHDLWRHGQLRLALGDEGAATRLLDQASEIAHSAGLERLLGGIQATKLVAGTVV